MPDRHSELPAHPDLEYYRKQAKHLLCSYEAGDAAARGRAGHYDGWSVRGRCRSAGRDFPTSISSVRRTG